MLADAVLVRARSATGLTVSGAVSVAGVGVRSEVAEAVFVTVVPAIEREGRARIVIDVLPPTASVPTLHVTTVVPPEPGAVEQPPCPATAEEKVNPAGSVSVTVVLVEADGPSLRTCSLKPPRLVALIVPVSAALVRRSVELGS